MKGLLAAMLIARGLDAGTSCLAFSRGYQEAHPGLPSVCVPTVTAHLLIGTTQVWALTWLSEDHPRLARWLAGVSVGTSGVAVVWNVGQLRQTRRQPRS